MKRPFIQYAYIQKIVLLFGIFLGLIYYSWWFEFSHIGNYWLYGLLFFGETYHILMAFTFWYTIWPKERPSLSRRMLHADMDARVAVFIPVVSEPIDVVERTIMHAKDMHYKNKRIYILNDAFVAGQQNWRAYEELAARLDVSCITRRIPGGAKAGNVNNAMKQVNADFIALFDADMRPMPEFLDKTMPYFFDERMAFVQTPQYYNNASLNAVTTGAWEQQNFFFGPVLIGKNNYNAAFICGTNVVVRKKALDEVGGLCEDNIAEDFLTSLFLHQRRWQSMYIPEVLATGFAPFDMGAYYKQQLRWARGSLEVLFGHNPLFKRHLSFGQKVQYLSSALYYFNGLIVLIDMLIPIMFLLFNLQPVAVSTTAFALFFVPYMFVSLYIIYVVSGMSMTFRTFSFSQSSFYLQLVALWSVITKQKMSFVVTAKEQQGGNYLSLCIPHITYILLSCFAIAYGVHREGVTPAIVANVAWVVFNMSMFIPFISAAWGWNERPKVQHGIKPAIT